MVKSVALSAKKSSKKKSDSSVNSNDIDNIQSKVNSYLIIAFPV